MRRLNLGFGIGPATLYAQRGTFQAQAPGVTFATTSANPSLVASAGAFALTGQSATLSSSSAALPVAPTVTNVYPQTQGMTVMTNHQAPAGSDAVLGYTAEAVLAGTPTGITGVSQGPSTRVDIPNLSSSSAYTVRVKATNANGDGPWSSGMPSATPTITPNAYADYWIHNGTFTATHPFQPAATGINPGWGLYPGTYTVGSNPGQIWNATPAGITPPMGTNVIQLVSGASTDGKYTLPFYGSTFIDGNNEAHWQNFTGTNGRFFLDPYGFMKIQFRPTVAGQGFQIQLYTATWYDGILTQEAGSSETVMQDTTQNWSGSVFNPVEGQNWGFIDYTSGGNNGIASWSSTTLTMQSGTFPACAAGDRYVAEEPDLQAGNLLQLGGGDGTYGPATMTVGAWSSYKIPLSAFGFSYRQMLKLILVDNQTAGNTVYAAGFGFSAT